MTIAHLVGSVPLDNAEAVFRRVGDELGAYLKRLPDGETGRRSDWIGFVRRGLGKHPGFEKDLENPPYQFTQWDGKVVMEWPYLQFVEGADRASVTFETGYAEDAIESYKTFERLQGEGAIPEGVRYQACSATPLAIAYMYIKPDDRKDFTAAYTRHLVEEMRKIADAIPHDRLCYQWDVCQEVLMWEGYFDQNPDYKEEIVASLAALGDAVPSDVELGYHLCYGSPLDEHCVQPKDMGVLVEMAQGILGAVTREITFLHLPVPHERDDAAYFAPLKGLSVPEETALYLGCIHPGDEKGNDRKLALASAQIVVDGIGSECGWGRGDPDSLGAILDAHKVLASVNSPS